MTWFKFLGWLAGLYSLYYLLLVLWDIARGKQGPSEQGWTQELHFDPPIQVQVNKNLFHGTFFSNLSHFTSMVFYLKFVACFKKWC